MVRPRRGVHCVAAGIASLFLDDHRLRGAAFLLRRTAQACTRAGHGLGFQREIVRLDRSCDGWWLDDGRRSEEGRDVPGGRDGCVEITGLSVSLRLGLVFGGLVQVGVRRVMTAGRRCAQEAQVRVVRIAGIGGGCCGGGGCLRGGDGGGGCGRGAGGGGSLSRRVVVAVVMSGRLRVMSGGRVTLVVIWMVQVMVIVVGRRRVVVVESQRCRRGGCLEQATGVEAEHVEVRRSR